MNSYAQDCSPVRSGQMLAPTTTALNEKLAGLCSFAADIFNKLESVQQTVSPTPDKPCSPTNPPNAGLSGQADTLAALMHRISEKVISIANSLGA